MKTSRWVVFDLEGDGLVPKKLHCICWKDYEGKTGGLTSVDEYREFFDDKSYDVYIGHNIRRFDLPVANRLLDRSIGYPTDRQDRRIVDTLALSWYLDPSRSSHSLESYGVDQGHEKVRIDDWEGLTREAYLERCHRDVEINWNLWKGQLAHLNEIYGSGAALWKFLKYLDFKMYCAALAEQSRWKLDVKRAEDAIRKLDSERSAKTEALRAAMPEVPILKTYTRPQKCYTADGELSVLGSRWQERLAEAGLPPDYEGVVELCTGYDPPNPSSPIQLKNWLYSLGWKPATIKYVRDKSTGKIKEIPQINKEHGGGVCDSVLVLATKEPALDFLDGISVASHRIGLLRGFLRDADSDGYLRACVAGLTNTLRFKHQEIVNLPKVEKRYAADIRSCLLADNGTELCGADMSSLEDRLKQHFLFKHDPDYVRELMTDDFDPHLDLALQAGAITNEDRLGYISGDHECVLRIKPIRSIYKNGNYACQYGAGVSRLAITCNCDAETARRVHEAYWRRNWAIKAVAKEQKTKYVRDQQYLYNPISGFWYALRTEKDIFSTLVQGSACYVFDVWVSHIISDRPQLTAQFHDEVVLQVKIGHQSSIIDWLKETIKETNDYLKLNRVLDIGIQFGNNYAEIH